MIDQSFERVQEATMNNIYKQSLYDLGYTDASMQAIEHVVTEYGITVGEAYMLLENIHPLPDKEEIIESFIEIAEKQINSLKQTISYIKTRLQVEKIAKKEKEFYADEGALNL